MRDYPQMIVEAGHIEPAPRRVRGVLAGHPVFDTTRALYVWESPKYPQYYIPLADIDAATLVDEHHPQKLKRGTAHRHGLQVDDLVRPGAARLYRDDAAPELIDTVRFEWDALDAWFEEDEQVFVHPRNPYTRVDAIRSSRHVRVQLDGVVIAESAAPVLVFETGLPTRYYLPRTHVDFGHLVPSDTVTACPYKGVTTGYWSVRTSDTTRPDLAWSYDFPTAALLPIAGMIAFYNEQVDHVVNGELLTRPTTHFFSLTVAPATGCEPVPAETDITVARTPSGAVCSLTLSAESGAASVPYRCLSPPNFSQVSRRIFPVPRRTRSGREERRWNRTLACCWPS